MTTFQVPKREEVSSTNQEILDNLKKKLGFMPNLYATFAYSDNALQNQMTFAAVKTSLKNKEKDVVFLTVSQVNECTYCLAAHTAIAKMNGYNDEQVLQIRSGKAAFDSKLDALAKLAQNVTENRGRTSPEVIDNFFNAGYTNENLIDVIELVGIKTIANYVHNTTEIPLDFPAVPKLETASV